jgi:antitoxin VapB
MLALSPETEAMVRAEAIKLGKTEDEVIRNALATSRRRLMELPPIPPRSKLSSEERRSRVDAIIAQHVALPILDTRSDDEILGYDENGLFK